MQALRLVTETIDDTNNLPAMYSPPPAASCRQYLRRVAESVTFALGQLRALLEWLGEQALTVPRPPISERRIAREVLNRENFNPTEDSLVRKEMSRLRDKLLRYYTSEGVHDLLRIRADAGYHLRFETRTPQSGMLTLPCWLVLPFRADAEIAGQIELFLDELLLAIGTAENAPALVSRTSSLAYRDRAGDLREFAAECAAEFVIEGSLRFAGRTYTATVWIVEGQTGKAKSSGRFTGFTLEEIARSAAHWLLNL